MYSTEAGVHLHCKKDTDALLGVMIGTGRLNGPHSVVPKDYKMDGDSLLCLLGGGGCRGGKWRPYLDLEHYKVTDTTHIKAMSFCCRQ